MEWVLPATGAFLCFIAFLALGLSAYGLHHSIKTAIDLKAMQLSTHSVQLVPADTIASQMEKEEKALNERVHEQEHDAYDDLGIIQ